ncbi:hypothetical protein NCTGTJJY_CDS0065 [Serratia phage 92A1]|nr:hypothetical protein NCTGTJJY_CDS0065 [Serratia phage 92A1]
MFVLYTLEGDIKPRKMYFVDTKWGGPSYFNHKNQAWVFKSIEDAEEAKEILDDALVVPEQHFVEPL